MGKLVVSDSFVVYSVMKLLGIKLFNYVAESTLKEIESVLKLKEHQLDIIFPLYLSLQSYFFEDDHAYNGTVFASGISTLNLSFMGGVTCIGIGLYSEIYGNE